MKAKYLLSLFVPFLLTACNEEVPTADQVRSAFVAAGYGKGVVSQVKVEKCKAGAEREAVCDITLDNRTVGRRFIKNDKGDWLVSS